MASLVMVRTVCCESYKEFGRRCAICPHRPENQQALREFMNASRACQFAKNPSEILVDGQPCPTADSAIL